MPPTISPVELARRCAEQLLLPSAERVDVEGVPRSHLDALGAAGLLGLTGPPAYGGAGAGAPVVREVTEALAGACAATWFVTTQHAMPLAVLGGSGNKALQDRWLRAMCTGGALAGVAVAHVRRPGEPAVRAVRVAGGWRFDGHVGWMTSWGLCDVLLLGGLSPDGELVFVLVPAVEGAGLTASAPMRLAAMQATSTVTLDLSAFEVPDGSVASVEPAGAWLEQDRVKTANVSAAVFGIQADVVRRLAATAERRGDGTATELAERLSAEACMLRQAAYGLVDDVPAYEQVQERLRLRAAALALLVRSATALVTATGGSAMGLDNAAQRHLREAAFMLVQAQTGPVREATLRGLLEQGAAQRPVGR